MWFVNRIKEASTWAGLAGIAQGLAAVLPAHAAVLHGLTVVAGGIAVMVKDSGANDAYDR